MTDSRYAELHLHTAYSFLDGAAQPEELIAEAARLGLSAVAITDHDGLYGVVRFSQAAKEVGMPTIFGAELAVHQDDERTAVPDPSGTHLLVLARNPRGYGKLSSAIARAHLATGSKGRADYDVANLAQVAGDDWLILTGCRKGAVRRALEGGSETAGHELDRLIDAFGADNVAVELTALGDPRDDERNDMLAHLAAERSLPLVATGNVHYATVAQYPLATALASIRARESMDAMNGWLSPAPVAYLRSAEEMTRIFARYPGAVATAARLGDECAFDLSLVAPNLPPCPVPDGYTEATWLRELTYQKAVERYGTRGNERVPGAYEHLDKELAVIESLDFPGYFLIVHDIVSFCHRNGILCQGRGSAANSAVCFALGITSVDPVAHGLLFERFLSADREGPPDIDVDIESQRREEAIQYVYERYGRTHSAQVANVISYRPRSAVRDAARTLGYDVGQQDAWSKQIERWSSIRARPPGTPHVVGVWGSDAVHDDQPDPDIPDDVVDLAEQMLKLPRHLGIHSGGMVLCDRPIIDVCPVEWARMPGRTVLQWDKDDCADAGLVKFDLLGLGMLSALRIAFELIAETEGQQWTLATLPFEDPAVYDLLCAGDTVGVFQVESRAQMATLPRLRPRDFYGIVVEVALIRPGPIQGGSVHPYIARANGREPIVYPHPLTEPSLRKTLGVPLFQEQLMQLAIDVAGFTGAEADQLRRAMGSKRSVEKMERLKARLFDGMAERGVEPDVREEIYEKLKAFADFGFPESHAYSFAHLVYASAWLKVHHPAAFYAGLLAAQPLGFYSPQSLVADARRHEIVTLGPDIQASREHACVERLPADHRDHPGELAIRLGLTSVRSISSEIATEIVADRERYGPFSDLPDVAARVDLGVERWEALATAGAFDCFGIDRRMALWAAGALGRTGPQHLPGLGIGVGAPGLPGMTVIEQAVADVWATGISPNAYPTQFLRADLTEAGVRTVMGITELADGERARVAGVVTHRQRPGTAKGVTFLSLEDETGLLNVVCSAQVWKRYRSIARTSAALVVRGVVECDQGSVNLVADLLEPLSLRVPSRSRDFR